MESPFKAIVSDVKNAPGAAAAKFREWISGLRSSPTRRDYWAGFSALLVMLAAVIWSHVENVPALGIQIIFLGLLISNYILGFAETPRARLWSLVFFLISLVYWWREWSRIANTALGG